MSLLNFGHGTTPEQLVQSSEVDWALQKIRAYSTLDSGSHAITVRALGSPMYNDVLDTWFAQDAGVVEQWVEMLGEAEDPSAMLSWIQRITANYTINAPVIKFVDISSLRVSRGEGGKDQRGIEEFVPNPVQSPWLDSAENTTHTHSVMFMDEGVMSPPALIWEYNKIGDQLLGRLDPEHPFSVARLVEILLDKIRAKMTGDDLYSRLTSEYHNLLLAMHALQTLHDHVYISKTSEYARMQGQGDPYKRLYTNAVMFELLQELRALLNLKITFLPNEVAAATNGIGDMHAPDRFKLWLEACASYYTMIQPYFRNVPVFGMMYGMSAIRGYWAMYMTPSFERINYVTSDFAGGESYRRGLKMLSMNGFSSDIVLPVSIGNRMSTNYRTTRSPESMGVEITVPLFSDDDEQYAALKDILLVSNTTRKLDQDLIHDVGFNNLDVWGTSTQSTRFERKVLPIRGSMFMAGLIGIDPPGRCAINIIPDAISTAVSPVYLDGQLSEIPHKYAVPAEQVAIPWHPRM